MAKQRLTAGSRSSQTRATVYEQNAKDAYDAADDVIMVIAINAVILALRDAKYGASYAHELGPMSEEFLAIIQDSITLSGEISTHANAFHDEYPGIVSNSSLEKRTEWVQSSKKVAEAQHTQVRSISDRLSGILEAFITVWEHALHVRGASTEAEKLSVEALFSAGADSSWGLQGRRIIQTMLEPLDRICMIKGPTDEGFPELSLMYQELRAEDRLPYEVFQRMADDLTVIDRNWAITRSEIGRIQSSLDTAASFAILPSLMKPIFEGIADQYTEIAAYLVPYAREMQKLLEDLKTDFSTFVAKFSIWAKDKEADLTAQLEQLMKELQSLKDQLDSTRLMLSVFEGVGVFSAMLASVAFFSGPFAVVVGGFGIIALGGSLATIVALTIKIQKLERAIAAKEEEIEKVQAQIDALLQARQDLEAMGEDYLFRFGDNVNLLKQIWTFVASDAETVRGWLEDAKLGVQFNVTLLIKQALESADNAYTRMANYLKIYSQGLATRRSG
ncbi:hypothetical protein BO78DRAFT_395415 [Aspergillus sclerotiicarbonarius CBS 121057]|uniref:Uncharacterized protein n=1 Tax=Aspergillus sclerotiicarbonarius (strain CBS 121057 / IBT 28362) TaxID=1448318 RepID=A0A319EEW6_ASPSB|nr:hypothetical protein BO78DRAFT_395415 [Aspergillus sclerotiicarbonarius CBS 121057]